MSHGHIKTITFHKKGSAYELELDCEDPQNKVIENVTLIDGHPPEQDIDPSTFEESLDDDDWVTIDELLEKAK